MLDRQADRHEAAHAVAISEYSLGIDVRKRSEDVEARDGAGDVLRTRTVIRR